MTLYGLRRGLRGLVELVQSGRVYQGSILVLLEIDEEFETTRMETLGRIRYLDDALLKWFGVDPDGNMRREICQTGSECVPVSDHPSTTQGLTTRDPVPSCPVEGFRLVCPHHEPKPSLV